MDYDKKIGELKENLDKAKNLRFRAEARLEQLTRQKEEIINELNDLGVKPEDLDKEIERLKNEIEEDFKKAEELLPEDVIKEG